MDQAAPEIVVTAQDYDRLSGLTSRMGSNHPVAVQLQVELERAEVVEPDEIPADVVTMNSKVEIEDVESGERHAVTLVYPERASFEEGRLSVLAPVGAALLGMRAGQTIDWPLPNRKIKRVRVVAVTWQPQAAGELDP